MNKFRLLASVGTALMALMATAEDNFWLGGDPLTDAAWSDGVPTEDDVIHLTADHNSTLQWMNGLPAVVAGWVQDEGFTDKVVFHTSPAADAEMESLTITGDAMLNGGTWTHPVNTGNSQNVWFKVAVDGNLETGVKFAIDVTGKGFKTYTTSKGTTALAGPSTGNTGSRGASHGGQGGTTTIRATANCYGSYRKPTTLGSAAGKASQIQVGGGAVQLIVTGNFVHHGTIKANGANGGAAGGSVWIQANRLSGEGIIQARGATHSTQDSSGGGGGRIAIHLTDSALTRELWAEEWTGSLSADGGANSNSKTSANVYMGGAGTAYVELSADNGCGALTIQSAQVKLNKCKGVSGAAVVRKDVEMNLSALAVNTRGILGIEAGGKVTLPSFEALTSDGGEYAAIRLLNGGVLASEKPFDKLRVNGWTLESYGANALSGTLVLEEGGALAIASEGTTEGALTVDGLKINGVQYKRGTYDVATLAAQLDGVITGTGTITVTGKGRGLQIIIR